MTQKGFDYSRTPTAREPSPGVAHSTRYRGFQVQPDTQRTWTENQGGKTVKLKVVSLAVNHPAFDEADLAGEDNLVLDEEPEHYFIPRGR